MPNLKNLQAWRKSRKKPAAKSRKATRTVDDVNWRLVESILNQSQAVLNQELIEDLLLLVRHRIEANALIERMKGSQ